MASLSVPANQRASKRGAELVAYLQQELPTAIAASSAATTVPDAASSAATAAGSADAASSANPAASTTCPGVQVWVEAVETGDDERLAAIGLAPVRDLWQLRVGLPCPLPASCEPVAVRPFQPRDLPEFLRVNQAAFAWHPEQGDLDIEQFQAITQESWYDPNGFLLLELDNELAGYCWTKIHADETPQLGEIYVIAVNPDFAGRGLGAPLTQAGLEWLHQAGLKHGMLYVEGDNTPAQKIYAKLGFELHQVNRLYHYCPEAS